MNRRLPLLLGAAIGFGSVGIIGLGSAEAGGAHFSGHVSGGGGVRYSGGGGVRYGASASVGVHVGVGGRYYSGGGVHYGFARRGYGWAPYRWGVRGGIYVGGGCYYGYPYYCGYPYYGYPYYYGAEAVPSYYGGSYYPVVAGPRAAAVVAPRPQLPRFGIGASAGFVSSDLNMAQGQTEQDLSLLGRLRLTPGLLVEGELGRTSYNANGQDNIRVDRRLGGSLVYEIGAYNKLAPYLLAGLGVQQASVNGNYNTTQDFAEIGVGLRYAITPHLHIAADIRAGSRNTISSDMASTLPANQTARSVTPPPSGSGSDENYTRARLSAILYF